MDEKIKEITYYIKGMHCASCEILIEKKLLELGNIKSVDASTANGKARIEYEKEKPTPEKLNEIFKNSGYFFSDSPIRQSSQLKEISISLAIGLLIIAGFIGLNKLGLSKLINVNAKSSLPMFFIFGLLAGISSCAALVGGMVLSMSKQWGKSYSPHFIFNAGRLISYGIFGMLLGFIGNKLNFSLRFGPILIIAISIIMIFLALQMFGLRAFNKFQITMPKFITRFIAEEKNLTTHYAPFLMGALTFFLPCGFTITAQGLALLSGNAIQGGLIMFLFALGTLPMLLIIGLSSAKISQKTHLSEKFLKIAGILVLFFAIYNINSQLNILGIRNLNDINNQPPIIENDEQTIIGDKQILKINASSYGYSPNYFKVKTGIPVRMEITDTGTSGCTNAVISRDLFEGEIKLTPGQTSIKEFTPQTPGKYKFSCWMGMVSGTIEVIK